MSVSKIGIRIIVNWVGAVGALIYSMKKCDCKGWRVEKKASVDEGMYEKAGMALTWVWDWINGGNA